MTAAARTKPPVIGVMTCARPKHETIPQYLDLAVGQKYLQPLLDRGALPFMVPNFGEQTPFEAVLDQIDGLLLPGSLSNVHPDRYGGQVSKQSYPLDPNRDACTWGLLEGCIQRGKPIFALCRGMQEMNVFAGGSLHQMVHETPGCLDHRSPTSREPSVMYGAWQKVELRTGGLLHAILGADDPILINSLHLQGVDRLGKGVTVEARAADGLVEALSIDRAEAFCLGVQWHPEAIPEDAVSLALFDAFVDACRAGQ